MLRTLPGPPEATLPAESFRGSRAADSIRSRDADVASTWASTAWRRSPRLNRTWTVSVSVCVCVRLWVGGWVGGWAGGRVGWRVRV